MVLNPDSDPRRSDVTGSDAGEFGEGSRFLGVLAERAPDEVRGIARPLVRGIVGGLVGTVTMTVYRLPLFQGLPPTAEFWAQFVGGGDPSQYPLAALVLHLLYGAGAGGVFGLAVSRLRSGPVERQGGRVTAVGALYGALLSAFGSRVVLRWILGVELDGEESLVFHVGHLVYGLALGTWVGTQGTVGRSEDDGTRVDEGGPRDP